MPSSFTLGSHFEGFIKRQVGSGRYASASEVVRDSLRLLEEREEERAAQMDALRTEIGKGASSGPGIPADQVFDNLRARIRKLVTSTPDDPPIFAGRRGRLGGHRNVYCRR